jgi:hypothetical protein
MIRAEGELDEYGKRVFAPLRSTIPLDPQVAAAEKAIFLLRCENLQQGLIPGSSVVHAEREQGRLNALRRKQPLSLFKALIATMLVLIFLVGSSITVFAAQSSLPGQPLYTIKSWSEDIRLSMTFSTKAKLNLTLDYTNRRLDEISSLITRGKALNDRGSERLQNELDHALELASKLDDPQMRSALGLIKRQAENQGMTIEELISKLPAQAGPAIIHLQERLDEQVELTTIGELDPKAFRLEVRERLRTRQGPKHSPTSNESQFTPAGSVSTPIPQQEDNGNGKNHPSEVPGQGGPGNKPGQSTPGNENRKPKPTDTQAP